MTYPDWEDPCLEVHTTGLLSVVGVLRGVRLGAEVPVVHTRVRVETG